MSLSLNYTSQPEKASEQHPELRRRACGFSLKERKRSSKHMKCNKCALFALPPNVFAYTRSQLFQTLPPMDWIAQAVRRMSLTCSPQVRI
ncbi:hypothetical protein AVEN_213661-1 [Araneus ventricosus]|uniref:Uncharacterized protein n=1 Tax=Araneus ventricosus TaxID=182803 RepID=A0A4Y2SDN3_ARAVE|nr:hypothetical protein AVEN_213661-1 [Araneus ventricosus]